MNPTQKESISPWSGRLAGLTLGSARRHVGLTLYPLLGEDAGALDYLLLDAALAAGSLSIAEHGPGGVVPELELKNTGSRRVLIVDGEELIGAKQNRIVNTSVLVEAGATLLLPVSCVEAGRWRSESTLFRSAGTHYNARGRQKKVEEVSDSLAREGRARANQGRVWQDVDVKLSRLAVGSETQALNAAVEAHSGDLDRYAETLARPEAREVGAAFALGGELIGLDLFDKAATCAGLLPKLVASYALDALEETSPAAPPSPAAVLDWLGTVQAAVGDTRRGVGLGEDIRLHGPALSGAALVCEDVVVHLSAFRQEPAAQGTSAGRMARPSVRRGRQSP